MNYPQYCHLGFQILLDIAKLDCNQRTNCLDSFELDIFLFFGLTYTGSMYIQSM